MSDVRSHGARLFPWLKALCLILAVFALAGAARTALYCLREATTNYATLDASFSRVSLPDGPASEITSLGPNSPLAAAGLHTGDRLRFERPVDDQRIDRVAGETARFTLLRPPHPVAMAISVPPLAGDASGMERLRLSLVFPWVLDSSTTCFSVLVGLLIVLRSRQSWALLSLGFSFIVFDCYLPLPWHFWPDVFPWALLASHVNQGLLAGTGYMLFASLLYRETVGPVGRGTWRAIAAYGAAVVLVIAWKLYNDLTGNPNIISNGVVVTVTQGMFLLTLLGLIRGWRRSRQEVQKRYAMATAAICLVIAADVCFTLDNLAANGNGIADPLILTAQALSVAGHALFAYAVLRDKVVDLGFVINRAVVYGVISAMVLVVFGIVEWAAEHFMPFESREKSALLDAAIALGVYLIFHRIKDSVEHLIERLLFHKWQANEEKLRRFVKEADFITEPAALMTALITEIARFSQGAEAAVYLNDDLNFLRRHGTAGLPGELDSNDPALVAMRARHSAIEPSSAGSGLAAALLLPLSHRGHVFGCVLVTQRPDGVSYRPDEIEVLAWAASHIGLDFHALKAEALETEASRLREQNAALSGAIGKAMALAGS